MYGKLRGARRVAPLCRWLAGLLVVLIIAAGAPLPAAAAVSAGSGGSAAQLAVTPAAGPTGTVLHITGNGFAGQSSVTLMYRATWTDGAGTSRQLSGFVGTAAVDDGGSFALDGRVQFSFGPDPVCPPPGTALASEAISALHGLTEVTAPVQVAPWLESLWDAVHAGGSVTLRGCRFAPGPTFAVTWGGTPVPLDPAAIQTSQGVTSIPFTLPSGVPSGQSTLAVSDGTSTATIQAVASLATLTVAPASAASGDTVQLAGAGFAPGEKIISAMYADTGDFMGLDGLRGELVWSGPAPVAGSSGQFAANWVIPSLPEGSHLLTVKVWGEQGNDAVATLTVAGGDAGGGAGGDAGGDGGDSGPPPPPAGDPYMLRGQAGPSALQPDAYRITVEVLDSQSRRVAGSTDRVRLRVWRVLQGSAGLQAALAGPTEVAARDGLAVFDPVVVFGPPGAGLEALTTVSVLAEDADDPGVLPGEVAGLAVSGQAAATLTDVTLAAEPARAGEPAIWTLALTPNGVFPAGWTRYGIQLELPPGTAGDSVTAVVAAGLPGAQAVATRGGNRLQVSLTGFTNPPGGGPITLRLAGLANPEPGSHLVPVSLLGPDGATLGTATALLAVAPAAARLAFVRQPPADVAFGAEIAPAVAMLDHQGQVITGSQDRIALSVVGPVEAMPVVVRAAGGVATFAGLRPPGTGVGLRLRATNLDRPGLPPVESTPFSITRAQLLFTADQRQAADSHWGQAVPACDPAGPACTGRGSGHAPLIYAAVQGGTFGITGEHGDLVLAGDPAGRTGFCADDRLVVQRYWRGENLPLLALNGCSAAPVDLRAGAGTDSFGFTVALQNTGGRTYGSGDIYLVDRSGGTAYVYSQGAWLGDLAGSAGVAWAGDSNQRLGVPGRVALWLDQAPVPLQSVPVSLNFDPRRLRIAAAPVPDGGKVREIGWGGYLHLTWEASGRPGAPGDVLAGLDITCLQAGAADLEITVRSAYGPRGMMLPTAERRTVPVTCLAEGMQAVLTSLQWGDDGALRVGVGGVGLGAVSAVVLEGPAGTYPSAAVAATPDGNRLEARFAATLPVGRYTARLLAGDTEVLALADPVLVHPAMPFFELTTPSNFVLVPGRPMPYSWQLHNQGTVDGVAVVGLLFPPYMDMLSRPDGVEVLYDSAGGNGRAVIVAVPVAAGQKAEFRFNAQLNPGAVRWPDGRNPGGAVALGERVHIPATVLGMMRTAGWQSVRNQSPRDRVVAAQREGVRIFQSVQAALDPQPGAEQIAYLEALEQVYPDVANAIAGLAAEQWATTLQSLMEGGQPAADQPVRLAALASDVPLVARNDDIGGTGNIYWDTTVAFIWGLGEVPQDFADGSVADSLAGMANGTAQGVTFGLWDPGMQASFGHQDAFAAGEVVGYYHGTAQSVLIGPKGSLGGVKPTFRWKPQQWAEVAGNNPEFRRFGLDFTYKTRAGEMVNLNVFHYGNDIRFGQHLAFGSAGNFRANLHFYGNRIAYWSHKGGKMVEIPYSQIRGQLAQWLRSGLVGPWPGWGDVLGSWDPNDIAVTPAGVGDGRWVRAGESLQFRVRFENEGSFAAHTVRIDVDVDPDLDPDSLQVTGSSHPDVLNYVLAPDGQQLTLLLPGIELPPNDDSHAGEGWVDFTLRPRAGAPGGAEIRAQAQIYFDYNPPVVTNEEVRRLDRDPPAVALAPLPAAAAAPLTLRWQGQDQAGIAGVDVLYAPAGGEFTLWRSLLPGQTEAEFAEPPGTYAFRLQARDLLGHATDLALAPITTVTLTGGAAATDLAVTVLDGEAAAALRRQATAPPGVRLLDWAVAVRHPDGPDGAFPEPATVALTVAPAGLAGVADPDRLGLFRLDAGGSLAFAGGRWQGGRLLARLPGTGTYLLGEVHVALADMAGHWARRDVELMAAKLVVKGLPDGRFDPAGPVTRAQFAAMLVRAMGAPPPPPRPLPFSDVGPADWFYPELQTAVGLGVVAGDAGGAFRPHDPITRVQVAVMVARALRAAGRPAPGAGEVAAVLAPFRDAGDLPDWARADLALAIQAGILGGRTVDLLDPHAGATRAEAAVMVARYWRQ